MSVLKIVKQHDKDDGVRRIEECAEKFKREGFIAQPLTCEEGFVDRSKLGRFLIRGGENEDDILKRMGKATCEQLTSL